MSLSRLDWRRVSLRPRAIRIVLGVGLPRARLSPSPNGVIAGTQSALSARALRHVVRIDEAAPAPSFRP